MKIVVVSDNHYDYKVLERILLANQDADLYLHLGDSQMRDEELYPFIGVKGNNDHFSSLPRERYIDTKIGKIYMHHGNFLYGVTPNLVEMKNCKIFLHGHIHRRRIQKFKDTYVVCPGSTSLPRGGEEPSYLIINIKDNEEPEFIFKDL